MLAVRHLRTASAALISALAIGHAQAETYILFDGTAAWPGPPVPTAIAADGTVVGNITVTPAQGGGITYTSFVRAPDGTFTTFRADPALPPYLPIGAYDVNDAGIVVGWNNESAFTYDISTGATTLYQEPGSYWTAYEAINNAGVIAGANNTPDGIQPFVLKPDGTKTMVSGAYAWFTFKGINATGDAAAIFNSREGGSKGSRQHGMIVSHDGTQTPFDFTLLSHPEMVAFNDSGAIAGYAAGARPCLKARNCTRGFVRAPDGTFTAFQVTGSDGVVRDTFAMSMNNAGTIVGYHSNGTTGLEPAEGFIRDASGSLTSFSVPNMTSVYPTVINDSGVIAGYVFDANSVQHGFIRMP